MTRLLRLHATAGGLKGFRGLGLQGFRVFRDLGFRI